MIRVATFAKFREMQKMILRNKFRENWVRKTAKIASADLDPIRVQISAKRGMLLTMDKCTNLIQMLINDF